MSEFFDNVKKLRKYGFPMKSIIYALELYNNDYDMTLKRLTEIYDIIGDNPDIVIKRNEEKLINEVKEKRLGLFAK